MPKIIDNLADRLKEEARRQLAAEGYSAMTVRSVAAACAVGVGTVYNYYPSKDALVAACLLEDWDRCVSAIQAVSAAADDPEPVVRSICSQLREYHLRHSGVFRDAGAAASFAGAAARYHQMLRSQLAGPVRKFCRDDFAAEFIAEALLCWTMEGREFEQLYPLTKNLFVVESE